MIKAEGGKLELKGNIAEVSAECILVLRELYKRMLAEYPEKEIANGILLNMITKVVAGSLE